MEKDRNIGLLGGTFDPVHEGHLGVARQLLLRYDLGLILFIPAAYPPHKRQPVTSFGHRVAMLEAALADSHDMSVSLIEAERPKPSYTIDTLLELKSRLGDKKFHLIMGADQFVEFHLWHRFSDILDICRLIVVGRPGFESNDFHQAVGRLSVEYQPDSKFLIWRCPGRKSIHFCSDLHLRISSTEIRNLLSDNRPVDRFLPESVLKYIQENGLYQGRQSRSLPSCDT